MQRVYFIFGMVRLGAGGRTDPAITDTRPVALSQLAGLARRVLLRRLLDSLVGEELDKL